MSSHHRVTVVGSKPFQQRGNRGVILRLREHHLYRQHIDDNFDWRGQRARVPGTPAHARDFLLKEDVVFLNHGSFGACPREVFEIYQTWQRELEAEPVTFLGRRFAPVMKQARQDLAAYLGADADDLVYYPNATQGLNVVIQSLAENLPLVAGDEILSTSHEYGALDKAWTFVSEPRGVIYNRVELAPPFTTAEFADRFLAHVGPRTRIVYLSHITSPTALRFPVELIVKRARALGLITVIDGAHAPGQVAINLTEIDADFYSGNCHKWLCAPKGSGFLHARRDMQKLLRPVIIGHGWRTTPPGESVYVHEHQWRGTFDPAPYLTVPAQSSSRRTTTGRASARMRMSWQRTP